MAIGEVFLSAFLQVLFEKIVSIGGSKFLKLIGGDDLPKTIKKWKNQFAKSEAQLEDAELQQFHRKPVKSWLNKFQDLACDIEDILDHIAIEARRYELQHAEEDQVNAVDGSNSRTGFLNVVQNFYANSSRAALSTLFKPVNQDKIDEITERLQDLENEMHTLNLTAHKIQHQTIQTESLRSQRESISLVGKVFGRDDEKEEIITMLLKDDQNTEGYVVIPIVGTGGIGKTTLAQYVYNDEKRYIYRDEQLSARKGEQQNSNFDLKAWVCVSDVFDIKRVTIDIINNSAMKNNINSVTQGKFDCSNLEQAQVKLQEVLIGKKFFIVLDDIWTEKYGDWDRLQIPFRGGAKGSRVMMTTRIEKIAKKMTKNHHTIIRLPGLSDDDCWRLFQYHADEGNDDDNPEIKDDVIRKCKGSPLAAKALGGLLKSTTERSQRRQILESNVWGEEYEDCEVLPVLQLSYHHMPSHLKRVFAYCSVFPKDYEFEEMEVVLLWMAQGFLPDNQIETMEDMGRKYINDLVLRSLFEKREYGKFVMHDLIHDVANLAAGNVCYVMDGNTRRYAENTRHLFITQQVQTLGNHILLPQLRTFLCKYDLKVDHSDFFRNISCIRTLHLVSNQIEVLPDSIGDLKHLRYLSLKFPRIKVLPESVSCLWNLQTLCLDGCYELEKIPHIGSLKKLRHMYINENSVKEMPLGIEKLTNLQTLGKFVLGAGGGSRVRQLGMLNHLRERLEITGLENVTEVTDAEEAQLHKKESLEELHMNWGTSTDEVDDMTKRSVIEMLQPHTNINKCELDGYMCSTFPSWLGDSSFINMVAINLKKCHKCEWLPPMGQLPSLRSLVIEDMNGIKEVGLEFYGHCSTPFPSLNKLVISCMESWEKWVHPAIDNTKPFPILETIDITDCPSLQGDLPPHLASLEMLYIKRCGKLQSLALKNPFSLASRLEVLSVEGCESMVSISHIPLTLKLLGIKNCENLRYVEFYEECEQPTYTNISPGSDDEKVINSEEGIRVSPKASLELPLLASLKIKRCPCLRSLQQSLLTPALQILELRECKNMEMLPVQLLNLTSLNILHIDQCPEIKDWKLHLLASVKLIIRDEVDSSADTVNSTTDPPSSLVETEIAGYSSLSESFILKIKFESFGDSGLPLNIIYLQFMKSDVVKQHLTSDPNGCIEIEFGRFLVQMFESPRSLIQSNGRDEYCF